MRTNYLKGSWRWLVAAGAVFVPATVLGALTIPHSFTPNTPIKAAEVNANFSAVKTEVDAVGGQVNAVDAKVNTVTGRVDSLTTRTNTVEGKVNTLTTRTGNLETGLDRKQDKPERGMFVKSRDGQFAAVFASCSSDGCTIHHSYNSEGRSGLEGFLDLPKVDREARGIYNITIPRIGGSTGTYEAFPQLTTFGLVFSSTLAPQCNLTRMDAKPAAMTAQVRCVDVSKTNLPAVDTAFSFQVTR